MRSALALIRHSRQNKGNCFALSRGSQTGVHVPPGVHFDFSRGALCATEYSYLIIVFLGDCVNLDVAYLTHILASVQCLPRLEYSNAVILKRSTERSFHETGNFYAAHSEDSA